MRRSVRERDELIRDVVDAWNAVDSRDKPELMVKQPDLYFACAWLAAFETVAKERGLR